nr:MAG TPA: hypothetical protein [Bacteriophage sp.]
MVILTIGIIFLYKVGILGLIPKMHLRQVGCVLLIYHTMVMEITHA